MDLLIEGVRNAGHRVEDFLCGLLARFERMAMQSFNDTALPIQGRDFPFQDLVHLRILN